MRSVICQGCLDIRSLSARTNISTFDVNRNSIFGRQNLGEFPGEILNFRKVFINDSNMRELENGISPKTANVFS